MKLNHKIKIDLLEFFQTGKFECLKPGQTKEWILKNFPDPDHFGIGDTLETASIWCYGNLELHFHQQELWMIYSDYINCLDGGQSIELMPWILGKEGDFSLERLQKEFNRMRLDYSLLHRDSIKDMVELTFTQSQVKLTFHGEENQLDNPNVFQLGSFNLTAC